MKSLAAGLVSLALLGGNAFADKPFKLNSLGPGTNPSWMQSGTFGIRGQQTFEMETIRGGADLYVSVQTSDDRARPGLSVTLANGRKAAVKEGQYNTLLGHRKPGNWASTKNYIKQRDGKIRFTVVNKSDRPDEFDNFFVYVQQRPHP